MNKKFVVSLTPEERTRSRTGGVSRQSSGPKNDSRLDSLESRCWPRRARLEGRPDSRDIRGRFGHNLSRAQTFVEEGISAVLSRKPLSRRRPRKLDGEQEAYLIALACGQPPPGRRRWTVRLLADKFIEMGHCDRVSAETVRQTLKKTNCVRIW